VTGDDLLEPDVPPNDEDDDVVDDDDRAEREAGPDVSQLGLTPPD
jgi:hypothetical protein